MGKVFLASGIILVILIFAISTLNLGQNYKKSSTQSEIVNIQESNFEPFTARFKIQTNGTTRIFTDKKYHNLSTDVYITANDPQTIYINKDGIKWSDFFKTLPMSLTKECLITGTKQTFCSDDKGRLFFTINNILDPDVLDKQIQNDDLLIVTYKLN